MQEPRHPAEGGPEDRADCGVGPSREGMARHEPMDLRMAIAPPGLWILASGRPHAKPWGTFPL